jgi:uncharacterized membrane protein
MNYLFLIPALTLLISCSSKDEKFCDCLDAGEKLNNFSTTLFDKDITSEMKKEMEALKKDKQEKCKAYEMMSGEKMLELKKECAEK